MIETNLQSGQGLFGDAVMEGASAVTQEQLGLALKSAMLGCSLDGLVAMITNPASEIVEYVRLLNGEPHACGLTSLLFNPHRLATSKNASGDSQYGAFSVESFFSGLARVCLAKRGAWNSRVWLHEALRMNVNGYEYVNEFPPSLARDLCIQYGVTRSDRVLDPCAGWGGRMLGVSAVCDRYAGFEPSSKTFQGLKCLEQFIKQMRPEFQASVQQTPFEDGELEPCGYDFALTSPPYFDTELYSDDPGEACVRYHNYGEYVDGFFGPLVYKTMKALKPGSTFVLNIGNRAYPMDKSLEQICAGKYDLRLLKGFLGGKGGLHNGEKGELFYAITRWT